MEEWPEGVIESGRYELSTAQHAKIYSPFMSAMRHTMERQPADLVRLLRDADPTKNVANRIHGRRTFLVGTGTSWHAANHGAWLLRGLELEVTPFQGMDFALYPPTLDPDDVVVILSHRNTKRYTRLVLDTMRARGHTTIAIGARGVQDVDIETVDPETSHAFTASHLGALFRLAQVARELGAVYDLEAIPESVSDALTRDLSDVVPPKRLLQYVGTGPNQWTAAEGALKVRETARVASDGQSVEQFLHGPAVALDERDALVSVDGGGPGADRLREVCAVVEASGARTHRLGDTSLGEPLSVFPLTVGVHRIALAAAEHLGTDPDAFGFDMPGRRPIWERVRF